MPGAAGAAGAAPAAGGAAPAAAPAEEQTEFAVKLEGFDAAQKIKVIKEVRAATELGLKEAKDLVEGAPAVLKKGLKKEDAEAIKEKIEKVGGKVVLE
jgi:large subunit ribosomal protein L7/L12